MTPLESQEQTVTGLRFRRLITIATVAFSSARVAHAQSAATQLEIVRDGAAPVVFTAQDIARMPHQSVQGSDHGKMVTFSAVPLLAVLRQAGVAVDSVKGPMLSMVVVAAAKDGYRATFSLGELAADLGRTVVYVADAREGAALSATEGPLRLVVPNDQRPARWVRQVVRVTVRRMEP